MRQRLLEKRIPTLFGLLLLIIGIGITALLVRNGAPFLSNAAPDSAPQHVQITDVTDTSFTVSYTTTTQTTGALSYGKTTALGQVALDQRDQIGGVPQKTTIHYIVVNGLAPASQYYFTIKSGSGTYTHENVPFTVVTGPTITASPSEQKPLVGSVHLPDGRTPTAALIYVTADGGQTVSALAKPDGRYILPINAVRTEDLTGFQPITDSTALHMLVRTATDASQVTLLANGEDAVPLITLSNDYDFTVGTEPLIPASTNLAVGSSDLSVTADEATKSALPTSAPASSDSDVPSIQTPQADEKFNDQQPNFTGTALPGEKVEVEIHSDTPLQASVIANKDGSWSYRPSTPLKPGKHTITIKTKNDRGILQTITQSFVVFAEGSSFTEPSISPVQPTPTPTTAPTNAPTAVPTAMPTEAPTATDTPVPSPTQPVSPTPTLLPTATPTLAPTILPTGGPTLGPSPTLAPLPKTGSSAETVMSAVGIGLMALGVVLFLFTGGLL